ncbi:MAG TPA: type 4a pilus biogenesis protein PilO [Rubrobacteraceae bacterium]|nr:type 4a pilus biogenesis protein PilO [Rubrobacteraceae bacterium]
MSSRDRNILLLGLLVIVLLIVGYYFLLLSPLLNELDDRAQERDDKQAQLANLQEEVAQLEAVRREAPEIERQLLELSKRLPTQPEIPTFMLQIEEIANASGVTQLSIEPGTPGPPEGGGDFTVLPITMTFQGTYEQMQDFLLRTRNLARLVTVRSVTFCRTQPLGTGEAECPEETATEEITTVEEIEELLQVELEAEIYFQPSGVPSGTAPTAPTSPETTTPAPPAETTGAQGGAT